ncbi:MAG: LytTR family DNA-binding domain-containing protein, partial [Bacteroidota bacterium]
DVVYLEADGRYTTIFTEEKRFVLRMPLSELANKFTSIPLLQSHRSYQVNLSKVDKVDLEMSVIHAGKHEIPLSKRNKDQFLKQLEIL